MVAATAPSSAINSIMASPGLFIPKNKKDQVTFKTSCIRKMERGKRMTSNVRRRDTSHIEQAISVNKTVHTVLMTLPEGVHTGFNRSFWYQS